MLKRCLSGCLLAGIFGGIFGYPPLAGAQGLALDPDRGVELLHMPSADQSGIDSYTKLMLHIENNVTDSAAAKTVTNNNVTFTSSIYKMGGYSGVFNGSKIQPR